ncbi:hypothetical protein M3650_16075 [Paenibacillus sp. MER TA 81-3]|uniref:hypothetical protein n=1 Tax=Paenibacillus sp. MER TA 81-3 TaxID=2939573 RepID=UPI00203A8FC1|nr:hypothetical protein [Paenibacillus sp. MER TA 81-3]MCM3340113.1 hypothetical protein [Paenibacillus sp. MER TA 81-3]
MGTALCYRLQEMKGSSALYAYGQALDDMAGLFVIDLDQHHAMMARGQSPAIEDTIYLITKCPHDENFFAGIRVFFHIYKHYLEHGIYAEEGCRTA